MSLVEKLPGLADAELASLHANAVRLGRAGTARQRASAAELFSWMPVCARPRIRAWMSWVPS